MSIVLTSKEGWVIDQELYTNENCKSVLCNGVLKCYVVNPHLYDITSQFLRPDQKPRSLLETVIKPANKKRRKKIQSTDDTTNRQYEDICESADIVQSGLAILLDHARELGLFKQLTDINNERNKHARLFSNNFYRKTSSSCLKNCKGGNSSNQCLQIEIDNENYIIPRNCLFYCYDIREIESRLDMSIKYDIVLLDPPWWNKYIRRKKCQGSDLRFNSMLHNFYSMLHNSELINMPIQNLLKSGGLVAIWCTNAPSHLQFIKEDLFPKWNLIKEATWYWMKLTVDGKPICDFAQPPAKQPFEQIIFGRFTSRNGEINNKLKDLPDKKIIASVPSALHSHKPNLAEILSEFLPKDPVCLELFARSLQTNWTSYGLETIRLQHISLYNEVSN